MKQVFSLRNTWDLFAILASLLAFASAMNQFIVGKHYMIPTAILLWTVVFGNLARYGLRGERWAKYLLFWFGVLMTCMAFMGIFMAGAPKEKLGALFLPVWVTMFLAVAWLTWQYQRKNTLSL